VSALEFFAVTVALLGLLALCVIGRLPIPARGWLASLWPVGIFLALVNQVPTVAAGGELLLSWQWVPSLGIELSFRLDGLSLLFGLLITGTGAAVFAFSGRYLATSERQGRFLAVLTFFAVSMLATVFANDLITLFVCWELTGLASFLLIGFNGQSASARASALQALLVTASGGLAMFAGFLLLGEAAGSYKLSQIIAAGPRVLSDPAAPAIMVLLFLGAFAKSAQFPMHSWLPNAMEAPTPVSAFLHSATMVKLGIYLLARFNPVFGEQPLWSNTLVAVGTITMLCGAVLALRETDLKRVLAYSTMVALGTLVMLLGMEQPVAATAAMTFLVVHALYKASLFLVAGIIDHETGSRDATRLGGLGRRMPVTAVVAFAAGLSMAGLPPFVGFVGKELVYEANLGFVSAPLFLAGAGLLANAAIVVVAAILSVRLFLGRERWLEAQPHDPPAEMLAGPILLAAAGIMLGLFPNLLGSGLIAPAVHAVMGRSVPVELAAWHGFTPMLGLSALTIALGIVAYLRWNRLNQVLARWRLLDDFGPDQGYRWLLERLQILAAWQTRTIQTGSMRFYMIVIFVVTIAAILPAMLLVGPVVLPDPALWLHLPPHHVALAVLLALGALATVMARSLIAAIMASGLVGYGSALIFVFFDAPDLAFTQFAVETLFIVLLAAVLLRLPWDGADGRKPGERRNDAVIAIGVGVAFTLVLFAALAQPFDPLLGDYFARTSVPEAHGRNVVNVVIVDFRAFDTLGEIAVLGLAGLAAATLLSRRKVGRQ
jgi:multicomponent Na+:H+ antiporter subunit A